MTPQGTRPPCLAQRFHVSGHVPSWWPDLSGGTSRNSGIGRPGHILDSTRTPRQRRGLLGRYGTRSSPSPDSAPPVDNATCGTSLPRTRPPFAGEGTSRVGQISDGRLGVRSIQLISRIRRPRTPSKSVRLRVNRLSPCSTAVAAINASGSRIPDSRRSLPARSAIFRPTSSSRNGARRMLTISEAVLPANNSALVTTE